MNGPDVFAGFPKEDLFRVFNGLGRGFFCAEDLAKVVVNGEAYLTNEHLILHLNAVTCATMPCAICNALIETELKIDHFYHAEPLEEIRCAVFDYSVALREALLLELPRTVECNGGNCPDRTIISPYMRSITPTDNFPFQNLGD